ncbi:MULTISPECIES: hypothetical protein [unclassified Streptomyces]|nr:hypothetical protein [Streptomyces sp. CB01580]
MPAFTTADGTELAYHVRGEGEPLQANPAKRDVSPKADREGTRHRG